MMVTCVKVEENVFGFDRMQILKGRKIRFKTKFTEEGGLPARIFPIAALF